MQAQLGRHGKDHRRQHGHGRHVGEHAQADDVRAHHHGQDGLPPAHAHHPGVDVVGQPLGQTGLGHGRGHGHGTAQQQEGAPDGLFLHGLPGTGHEARRKEHQHAQQADDAQGLVVQLGDEAALAGHEHDARQGKDAQQHLFGHGHGAEVVVFLLQGLHPAGDVHLARAEVPADPGLRQGEHAQVGGLQQHPVEVVEVAEARLVEDAHHDHVGQMGGHDEHAADHGAVDQGLDDDGLLGGAFFRRVTEQAADALHHGQQGGGAGIGRGHQKAQHDVHEEHAPDDAAHAGGLEPGQDAQGDALVQAHQLHDGPHQKGKQTQPDDVVGEPGKDDGHGRFAALPGDGLGDEQQGRDGDAGDARGHGLTDPHDAGPEHDAQHGHAVVGQAREGRQHGPEKEKERPGDDEARVDTHGAASVAAQVPGQVLQKRTGTGRGLLRHGRLLFS